jgi:hypothetical protein
LPLVVGPTAKLYVLPEVSEIELTVAVVEFKKTKTTFVLPAVWAEDMVAVTEAAVTELFCVCTSSVFG